jgi:hypothetical protein
VRPFTSTTDNVEAAFQHSAVLAVLFLIGSFKDRIQPLTQHDATLFKSLMAGEHCQHGFTNRDIRAQPG